MTSPKVIITLCGTTNSASGNRAPGNVPISVDDNEETSTKRTPKPQKQWQWQHWTHIMHRIEGEVEKEEEVEEDLTIE